MEITRLSELRPRTVWDIVDDAFDLYRERFVPLCAVCAIVGAPAYLAWLAFQIGPYARFMRAAVAKSPSPEDAASAMLSFLGALFLALPLLIAAQTLQHGAVAIVVQDYLNGKRDTGVRETYKRLFARFGAALGAGCLLAFFMLIGACAMGIGTLYAWIVCAFVAQVLVLERRGVWASFKRSRTLALASQGRVFGLLILMALIPGILSMGLVAVSTLVFELLPAGGARGDALERQFQQSIINQALESIVGLLLAPLGGIALSLLYYDLRVRQEGLDLVAKAEEIGYPLAPDPFGDVSSDRAAIAARREAERNAKQMAKQDRQTTPTGKGPQ